MDGPDSWRYQELGPHGPITQVFSDDWEVVYEDYLSSLFRLTWSLRNKRVRKQAIRAYNQACGAPVGTSLRVLIDEIEYSVQPWYMEPTDIVGSM